MTQVLKDSHGRKIGEIRENGETQAIYDSRGVKKGEYRNGRTYDACSRKLGDGNQLSRLI